MLTSLSNYYTEIISGLLLTIFIFLTFFFLVRKQNVQLNWGIFYATLYITIALPIINYICVEQGLWFFNKKYDNNIHLPYDLYFIWVIFWGVLPIIFFKGKHLLFISIFLLWVDILSMPLLEKIGLIQLSDNWLLGELALLFFGFSPAYFWAFCSIQNKHLAYRAILQVITIALAFLVGLPFILHLYDLISYSNVRSSQFITQLFIIIVFPALVAVVDMVKKGKGTPFPYDKTQQLIQTGVYAYCRNPIQWSFTFMFVPISIYFNSYFMLIAIIISIGYTYGVSDYQEYEDMEQRFGTAWINYKKNTPKWYFLWKPKTIPVGTIYFNASCNQCSQIRRWFEHSNAINLDVKPSYEFPNTTILQVTYVDHNKNEYKSVEAIACELEHINLAYASVAWFMRFPVINYVLQSIVDSMNFDEPNDVCKRQ